MDATRRRVIHDAMARLADGDRTGLPVLMEELWPAVLLFTQRGTGNAADAEDVAQEVFFRICSRIADFDRARDGVSWALGIAAYEVRTHRKKRSRHREVSDEPTVTSAVDPTAVQDERLVQLEIVAAFQAAVGSLCDDDRSALGLDSDSSNEVRGATLRKRRQRALARLRKIWRTLYGES